MHMNAGRYAVGIRRLLAMALLLVALVLPAQPATASHDDDGDGQYCIDSSNAHARDGMFTDTGPGEYCVVAGQGRGLPDVGGRYGADDDTGAVGAVPTRIDAGAGGAAKGGNPVLLGAVLTGATAAAAAGVARRRRRS